MSSTRVSAAGVLAAAWLLSSATVAAPPAPDVDDREAATLRRGDAYYHFLRARLAAMAGRPAEVMRELRDAAELAPDSADLLAESANLLAQLGRRDEAERLARKAIELGPTNPAALRVLADLSAAQAMGRGGSASARSEAIRLYERLAADPAADPQVLQILTNLRLLDDDLPGAVEAARRYSARKPGDPGGAKLLTQLLMQQGKPEEALASVLDFLGANPGTDELAETAAQLAARTGRWDGVEATARRMVQAHPERTGGSALLGEALLRQGRAEQAIERLEPALASIQDPRRWDAAVRALLGESYLRVGRHRDAAPLLETAVNNGPPDPLVRLHLASAYGTIGRLADATALARTLAGEYPGNPAILVILGECLAQQGSVAPAVEAFSAAVDGIDGRDETNAERRDEIRLRIVALLLGRKRMAEADAVLARLESPDRPAALEARARAAMLAPRLREARTIGRKLAAGGETGAGALVEGEALARDGRAERAEPLLARAIERLGDAARDRVAAIWRAVGETARADALLEEWVRREPANAEARFALGHHLERTGRFASAEGELRKAIELDPTHAQALNYLGYSLAERGERLDEALSLLRRALERDEWNGAYLDSLGWVHFRRGEFEPARRPLERAAREFPNDPTVLDHLGDLYEKLGDLEGAVRSWERALDAQPEHPEAIRAKRDRVRASESQEAREPTAGEARRPDRR